MMTICQNCGDKGDSKLLVYCVQCRISAEHRYCLEKLPKNDDEEVIWTCEECSPKVAKLGPNPSRKSDRISLRKERAVKVRINRKRQRNETSIVKAQAPMYRMAEATQLTSNFSITNEEIKNLPPFHENCGNRELKKQRRRRLIVDDGGSSDEESEPVKVTASESTHNPHYGPLEIIRNQPPLESVHYVHAQPVVNPIWRGCFRIGDEKNETFVRLVAHLSSKACLKVIDAASALPPLLNAEILPRSDAWPQSFHGSPPLDDSIALYFFPEREKDERVFDGLLNDIIENNLALKALIDNVELLVFSSRELPEQHWRFRRKYYLWAVFRERQGSIPLKPTDHLLVQNSSSECVTPSKFTDGSWRRARQRDLADTWSTWSLDSPSSTNCSRVSDPGHSPRVPKTINFSSCISSYFSKHDRPDNIERGRDYELDMEMEHKQQDKQDRIDVNFESEAALCSSLDALVTEAGRSNKLDFGLGLGGSKREDFRDRSRNQMLSGKNCFASTFGKTIF
ncbi:hypothetical protein L1049_002167 [Liquidambar formosana]|uniref:AIPP2-like SPOC-like domain-containing protein n=1 Tax=Liquidambar formosana TaxID=63359 RepID=A0AAP0NF60_LIQFO